MNIIKENNKILAIICKKNNSKEELNFITPNDFALQLGIHNRKKGSYVKAHKHIPYKNISHLDCQEIFYVENGLIKVGVFNSKNELLKEVTLSNNDLIILNTAHSVEFLKDTKLVEVKQGPYRGNEQEKVYIE